MDLDWGGERTRGGRYGDEQDVPAAIDRAKDPFTRLDETVPRTVKPNGSKLTVSKVTVTRMVPAYVGAPAPVVPRCAAPRWVCTSFVGLSRRISRASAPSPYRISARSIYDRYPMSASRYAQQRKEWFSRAFLIAAASVAGFRVSWTGGSEDVDGVDATVRDGGVTVDFQLKATSSPNLRNGCLLFDLDVPTYNKLRGIRSSPAYLLVATLPKTVSEWLELTDKEATLRHRSYWLKLSNMPITGNKARIRLSVPEANMLTAKSIQEIMQDARAKLFSDV